MIVCVYPHHFSPSTLVTGIKQLRFPTEPTCRHYLLFINFFICVYGVGMRAFTVCEDQKTNL